MAVLGEQCPQAQFAVTGVLGPGSDAHGPNEFLHVPTGRKLTAILALLLRGGAAGAAE
jgi:acetylornithine deacetylase/succinyl-diaminopimelate desuccinylase-like protein